MRSPWLPLCALPLAGALSCRVPPTEYTESPEEEPLNPTAFLDRFGGCVLEHAEESHGEAWCDASDEDLSRWHFVGRRPGSLSRLHIRAVIEQHLGGVRRCYENALQVWHHLAGRSEYQFAIEPDGHVRSVLLAEDNVGSDPLACCIAEVLRSMHFMPPTDEGRVIVRYPFDLEQAAW